jgi:TIR domain
VIDPAASSPAGLRIFISYRREDTSSYAGRLYDSIVARVGADQVFMDIDTIRPGSDFTEVLDAALHECDVLLALIGRTWLTRTDQNAHRRLDNPHDFVRRELEAALRRRIIIIPVLVQDTDMPLREQLPDSLSGIATRQAFELSDRRWRSDSQALLDELERLQHDKTERTQQRPSAPPTAKLAEQATDRSGPGPVVAGVGAIMSVLGLILGTDAEVLWLLGQLALVIGIIMVVLSGSRRTANARRNGAVGVAAERWHWGLAAASLGLAGLGVAGMMFLRGPLIGPFAIRAGWIILLAVGAAGYLSKGWTAVDALHVWRQAVVALVAALVSPALYFAAVWIIVPH